MTSDEIEKAIVETKVILGRIDERLKAIEESLKSTEKVLHGNGQPGVISRLTEVEVKQNGAWAVVKGIGSFILSILSAILATYASVKK